MDDFCEKQRQRFDQISHVNDEISQCNNAVSDAFGNAQQVVDNMQAQNNQALQVVQNADIHIDRIHTQFEEETGLKGKDIAFLFGAAAIQTARWALLPKLDFNFSKIDSADRMTAVAGGKIEMAAIVERLQSEGYSKEQIRKIISHDHINNYTWEKLLVAPVPYDAMKGSERIVIPGISEAGTSLYSGNHHVATWGHDPVWGWIFGPVNITTRTITFRDFQTYHVMQIDDTFNQKITYASSLSGAMSRAINLWSKDSKKLFISVAKQGMHLKSDKYTKTGLPIPFLSPEKAQYLLTKGWNSNEVERLFNKALKNAAIIGSQFGLSLIIDNLVRALHTLCYDESVDGSPNLYSIKTNKIICYSNAMAEIANGIYVAASRDLSKLDIGGYINFAKNLITNIKLQNQIKKEFLEKELSKKLYGEEYYWEES